MAKYNLLMSCGHEETVELFGKTDDRERKIKYFEEFGLCKECYKEMLQEQAEKEGLVFNATILPYIDQDDGGFLLSVWFSGNTKPYKDKIKALGGYRWQTRSAAADFVSTKSVPMCWAKTIKVENLDEETAKAVNIGASSLVSDKGMWYSMHAMMAMGEQKKWREKQEKIASVVKPVEPSVLAGHNWNQKIYGKAGSYTIYLDGEKLFVTDEQVEEIRAYLADKENYKKEIEKIM